MLVSARSGTSEPVGVTQSLSRLGEILTPNEVAAYLKVPKKTVYKLLQSGELAGFKAGKHWRVARDDLGAWIASKSQKNGERTK